jgi:sterol 3beta-glucosyltransferase
VSTVKKLEPFDPEHPNDFRVVYETPHGIEQTHMSVDTEQSAMQWRRAFEGALFRHAHAMWKSQHAKKMGVESTSTDDQWTMMRACVPLDRIRVSGMQDYHSFVTLLGLEIDLRDVEKVDFSPENDLATDHDGHQVSDKPPTPLHDLKRTASPAVVSPTSSARAPLMSPSASETGRRSPCRRTSDFITRATAKSPATSTSQVGRSSPSRNPSQMSTQSADTATGNDTPTKRFSLRDKLDRVLTPGSREPSPSGIHKASAGPQWLDSTIPGPLAKAGGVSSGKPEDWNESGPESEYSFNVAVQQEQTWFVGSLQTAIAEAKTRRYKEGAKRPKMVLNVAGYDCLKTDEDLDHTIERHISHSSDSGDEHSPEEMEDGPEISRPSTLRVKAARKAEKASMAAKIFGLNEEDGIWRKLLYMCD